MTEESEGPMTTTLIILTFINCFIVGFWVGMWAEKLK